jgi:hypothetical protein
MRGPMVDTEQDSAYFDEVQNNFLDQQKQPFGQNVIPKSPIYEINDAPFSNYDNSYPQSSQMDIDYKSAKPEMAKTGSKPYLIDVYMGKGEDGDSKTVQNDHNSSQVNRVSSKSSKSKK